jgi:nucleotide-binding universal stress UspA family protein
MISTRGRTRLQSFFMGEVSRRVLEYCPATPTWLLEPVVRKRGVLISVDSSENSLRAVDHAGFMLAGTDCPVTLFHASRQLRSFVPTEIVQDASELEDFWKDSEAQQVTPYIEKAKEKLRRHGLAEDQIAVKLVGSSGGNISEDIRKAANDYDCGTIVLGRRGLTGIKELVMGSVTRKILESFSGMAVWIVT